jgi:catechol 2,3-dioxygenase-like lactoylglutathione lyase family enzyme
MMPDPGRRAVASSGLLHHVELWVPDLPRAERSWGWLLTRLGAQPYRSWAHGRSWRSGSTYVVLEQSPALVGDRHERRSPGLNHLAFWVHDDLDALVAEAPASGPVQRLAPSLRGVRRTGSFDYLEDGDGYEVELVSSSGP